MKSFILGSVLSLLLCYGVPILADTPAVNFTAADVNPAFNITFSNGAGGFDLGWKFSVSAPTTVTALGVYDDFGDGLINSHPVGLYKANGTLLASTTVTTSDPLNGVFRYNPISALSITPGDYVLVSTAGYDPGNPVDKYTHDPANITFGPNITFIGNRVLGGVGNSLVFLNDSNTEVSVNPPLHYGWFGPNMMTRGVNVPEPAVYLSLAAMLLIAVWRKKQQVYKSEPC